jgi:hypothetical protein
LNGGTNCADSVIELRNTIDARHAKAVLKMQINKSDRNDAVGIARIMQMWMVQGGVRQRPRQSRGQGSPGEPGFARQDQPGSRESSPRALEEPLAAVKCDRKIVTPSECAPIPNAELARIGPTTRYFHNVPPLILRLIRFNWLAGDL